MVGCFQAGVGENCAKCGMVRQNGRAWGCRGIGLTLKAGWTMVAPAWSGHLLLRSIRHTLKNT